jgi:serine protease inhibitor
MMIASYLEATFCALLCAVITIAIAAPAGAADSQPPVAELSTASNVFGFRLLHVLVPDAGENAIISPLSIELALAMIYNGAAGETKTAIAKTLDASAFSAADFNRANRGLLDSIRKADPAVILEIANALWVQAGFAIAPQFLALSRDNYDAAAANVDFAGNPDRAAETINSWADRNTHGKIPTIVSKPSRSTQLMLTDAVYFKGRWTSAFVKSATAPRPFYLPDGSPVQTPMMTQSHDYLYFEDDRFQAIRLPYGNERFALYVFLPRDRKGLADLMRSLDEPHWAEWTSKLAGGRGTIVLPSFETSYGSQLNRALAALGMDVAFDPSKADFTALHPRPPQLYINDVEHKTWVKVDEEGTEAAAVTSIGVASAMVAVVRPPPFQMVVDHPFFCAIAERQSGAILFAGIVTDPSRH